MVRVSPGPAAAQAFRLGVVAGGLVGLAVIWSLLWTGTLSPVLAAYVLFAIFPVFLVFVAVVLSRLLGYDKDASALRPVYRSKDSE